ncbi:hypothetical protein ACMFMF_002000 [Clarireedia jacksonii]
MRGCEQPKCMLHLAPFLCLVVLVATLLIINSSKKGDDAALSSLAGNRVAFLPKGSARYDAEYHSKWTKTVLVLHTNRRFQKILKQTSFKGSKMIIGQKSLFITKEKRFL